MSPADETRPVRSGAIPPLWWITWATVLGGLFVLYGILGRGPLAPAVDREVLVNLVGLIPLFVSIIIRWLVLSHHPDRVRAFPIYVIGLGLAEGCGLLGLLLGGAYRDDLFVLAVLGVLQFVPIFPRRPAEL